MWSGHCQPCVYRCDRAAQLSVTAHSKPMPLGSNMLTGTGDIHMPLMELPRRRTVLRLHDARLVVYSAIALDEDEVAATVGR